MTPTCLLNPHSNLPHTSSFSWHSFLIWHKSIFLGRMPSTAQHQYLTTGKLGDANLVRDRISLQNSWSSQPAILINFLWLGGRRLMRVRAIWKLQIGFGCLRDVEEALEAGLVIALLLLLNIRWSTLKRGASCVLWWPHGMSAFPGWEDTTLINFTRHPPDLVTPSLPAWVAFAEYNSECFATRLLWIALEGWKGGAGLLAGSWTLHCEYRELVYTPKSTQQNLFWQRLEKSPFTFQGLL